MAREHRATKHLWPNRDATTRFPARAWREGVLFWRARRICPLSRTPCSATGRGGVICLVCSAPLFSRAEKNCCCTNRPDLPTCKTEANEGQFETEEPRLPPGVIRFSGSPIISIFSHEFFAILVVCTLGAGVPLFERSWIQYPVSLAK